MNIRDMTMNADTLTGLELEFHVRKALGTLDDDFPEITLAAFVSCGGAGRFTWDDIGPLIDRHYITVLHDGSQWVAGMNADLASSHGAAVLSLDYEARGATALEAVMRCLVKRGHEPRPAWETTPQEPQ